MAASDSYLQGVCVDAIATPQRRGRVSRARFLQLYAICTFGADWITFSSSMVLLELLHTHTAAHGTFRPALVLAAIGATLTAFLLSQHKSPAALSSSSRIRETEHVLRASIASLSFVFFIDVALQLHSLGPFALISVIAIPALLAAERHAALRIRQQLHARGYGVDRVVLHLSGPAQNAQPDPVSPRSVGLEIVAKFGDHDALISNPTTTDVIDSAILHALRRDLILMTGAGGTQETIRTLTALSGQAGVPAALIEPSNPIFPSVATSQNPQPQLSDTFNPHTGPTLPLQRILDITIAVPLLLLLAPLFFLIALAVRLDSPGPSFFIQQRVGKDGRRFSILKFRSMFVTAPQYELSPVCSSDPRITRIGRVLRRLSLDELPQLINVLVGDMALVGPRPEMPFLVERHPALHRQRLKAKPGITGLWQLSADRPRPIHENIHHDLDYIRNRGIFLDLAILVHTVFRATSGGI